jgi:competence protein ComEA
LGVRAELGTDSTPLRDDAVVSIDDSMPTLPFTRRQALALAAVLLLVLVLAGHQLRRSPAGADARPLQSSAPAAGQAEAAALVVHVVGAVRRPGLYRLPAGSRIADALDRAGGPTRRADTELVNLAAPVADGLQVVVPRKVPQSAVPGDVGDETGAAQGPVHLNTATLADLDALPGVGPVTAQKILDYREEHGAFSSVDELDAVPGIGPARMEQLRELAAP